MAIRPAPATLAVGDPMPRIVLREPAGTMFDSCHQTAAGRTRVYWLGALPPATPVAGLADALASYETDLRVVAAAAPAVPADTPFWLIDRTDALGRAVGATGAAAVVVDASGRLVALLPTPAPADVLSFAMRLHKASSPAVVQAQAPVLLLERLIEPELCQALIDHWRRGEKRVDGVASAAGASVAGADVKRRRDVALDDVQLFVRLRDCLVRRAMPAILLAFQTSIVQIETPRIGCYDAVAGGWFRCHRDNATPYTAHRQFALSLNLNADDEYDGGELRFREFGRQLYRPAAGAGLVFSCSLLHEVMPVTRGQRFGVFSFLHDEGHDAQYRRLLAEAKARGVSGATMRHPGAARPGRRRPLNSCSFRNARSTRPQNHHLPGAPGAPSSAVAMAAGR